MIFKKHISPDGIIIALCDNDLLGKKIETEKLQLDLTSNFYAGEEKSEEDIISEIRKCYIINACGKKTIDFLRKQDLIEEGNIIFVGDVPHAQIALFRG